MPSSLPKSSMSLEELAICEDFLDTHREYATGLFSNIEKVCQWHETDCLETREGRTCSVCELCSADGLFGATKKALVSLNDAEKHLQEVRTSLEKSVPSRGTPSRETLFESNLAKTILFCIITAGDTLRAQHTMWQARLQGELATLPSSDPTLQDINAGPGDLDEDSNGDIVFPAYSGPKLVDPETHPKLAAAPVGRVLGGACGLQVVSKVPPPPSDKKTRTSKQTAKLETATRGSDNHAGRSMTATLERRSKGTSYSSDAPAKTRTSAQTQEASIYHDLNSSDTRALDAQRSQDVVLEHAPSAPRSETALLAQETEPSLSSPELIVDPRVFRLRAQIARSDDTCRALVEWCRAWMADLQLDPQERHGSGPEASLMHESTMKDTRGYPPTLARGRETVEPGASLCKLGQVEEAVTNGLSHGDDGTAAQEHRFNSEQEELKRRWLEAQKRSKDRTRHLALV